MMIFSRWVLVILAAALASSCNNKKPAGAAKEGAAALAPKAGLAVGEPKLVEKIEAVLAGCEISAERGVIRKCKDPKAQADLQRQEASSDSAALHTYCKALQDKRPLVRELSLTRIAVVGQPERAARADGKAYDCLLQQLQRARQTRSVSILARVSAFVGTALAREKALLELLPKLRNRTAEIAVYNSLWPNGRLRVIDKLATVIKAKANLQLVGAVVRGFGRLPPKQGNERKQVCGILAPLMTYDQDLASAGAAAYRISHTCPEMTDEVLAAAQQMLRRQKFDQTYAATLGAWRREQSEHKWTDAQRRKAVGLLKTVIGSKNLTPATRGAGLRALYSHDPTLGARLAKQYSTASTPGFLRRAADQIIGKAKATAPRRDRPRPRK